MKCEEYMKFWRIIYSKKKKKFNTPPPPPPTFFTPPPDFFFLHQFSFLNVGNSMKPLENMKFCQKKFSNFIF